MNRGIDYKMKIQLAMHFVRKASIPIYSITPVILLKLNSIKLYNLIGKSKINCESFVQVLRG
ncbi:MAG: hypothetical protein ABIN57_09300 [Chitinophagaceae bacterium]